MNNSVADYNEKLRINKLHSEYKLKESRRPKSAYLLEGDSLYDNVSLDRWPIRMQDLTGIKVG